MTKITTMKSILAVALVLGLSTACSNNNSSNAPKNMTITDIAQNPEGIEYDKNDNTFLLSSINASPIIKVNKDGSYTPFTSGEPFPLSTAGLQVDYARNRLLVAAFNGTELFDDNNSTKGASFLRIYNLKTGVMEKSVNLDFLAPNAKTYFANDIAVDNAGNAYISDWYANVIYKVDINGKASLFWKNNTDVKGGPNGLDFKDDNLLVSLLNVNDKFVYANYGLLKIPVNNVAQAKMVTVENDGYTGFDGMAFNTQGNIVGITNNGKEAGGNVLMELSSKNNWNSAQIVHSKPIKASTTVAITPENQNYVIHQDFSDNGKTTWEIEKIRF